MSVRPAVAVEVLQASYALARGSIEFGSGDIPYGHAEHPTEDYVYLVIDSGIAVFDISDRDAPAIVGVVADAVGLISNVALQSIAFDSTGRYMYVGDGATTLRTYDLGAAFATIEDPPEVNTDAISQGNGRHVLHRIGSNLYILADTATNNSFQVVSLATPSNPSVSSTTAITGHDIEAEQGAVNVDADTITYCATDGGKVLSVPIASPSSFVVLNLPTYSSNQVRPVSVWHFDDTKPFLILLVFFAANGITHYFFMVYDVGAGYGDGNAVCTSEDIVGTAIGTLRAPVIASSPRAAIAVGGLSGLFYDLAVFVRDDTAGALGELRFYRVHATKNSATADARARVPRLVAAVSVANSYSLRPVWGKNSGGTDEFHAIGISADRSNALLILIDAEFFPLTDDYPMQDLTPYICNDPGIKVEMGIDGDDAAARLAGAGRMTFEIDNSAYNSSGLGVSGTFSPDKAPIFGDHAAVGAQIRLTVGGTVRWRGIIRDITIDEGERGPQRARYECIDAMGVFEELETDTIAGRRDVTLREILETHLDYVRPLPCLQDLDQIDSRLQTWINGPTVQDFGEFDHAGDRAYDERTPIASDLKKYLVTDRVICYLNPDGGVPGGFLRLQSIEDSINQRISLPIFDENVIEKDSLIASHGRDQVYNKITVRYFPREVETANPPTTVLFTMQTRVFIKPGETKTIDAPYRDPAGKAARIGGVDVISPVVATDYTFRAKKGGGGTNLNAQLSVSAVLGGTSAKIVVTNNGPAAGWFKTQIRGNKVSSQEAALIYREDEASIARYGPRTLGFDMFYTTDAGRAEAMADALLEVYREPRTFVKQFSWLVNNSQELLDQFLELQPGSTVAVHGLVVGLIDAVYWILGTSELGNALLPTELYGLPTYQVQKLGFTIGPRSHIVATVDLIPSELNFRGEGFVPPRLWHTGEIVTPEFFRYQISRNANAAFRIIKRQTADVSKNNTTFSDLTDVALEVKAGETWQIRFFSFFLSNATANVKYTVVITDVNGTVAAAAAFGRFGLIGNGAPVSVGHTPTFGNPVNMSSSHGNEDLAVVEATITAVYDCIVKIQAAQNTASGTSTFREHSFLEAWRHEGKSGVHTGLTLWTDPKTWIPGEEVTNTHLNTYLRDNQRYLWLANSRQTASLTKNANTTPSNLAGMAFTVASGEHWYFRAKVFCSGNAVADIKLSVTAPALSTGRWGVWGAGAPLGAGSTTSYGGTVAIAVSSDLTIVEVVGYIVAGGAGTVQIQGAQNTSDASDTIFLLDSFIEARRVSV